MPFQKGQSGNKETQFKKGEVSNPEGPKKGTKHFKTLIREYAEKNIDYQITKHEQKKMPAGEAVVVALFHNALYKRDVTAIKFIMEHVDGKTIAIQGGDEDKPILTEIVYRIVDDTCPQEREGGIGYHETKTDG